MEIVSRTAWSIGILMLGCKDLHNSFFDGFVFGCTDVVAFTKRVTVMKVCLTAEFIYCKEIL